MNVDIVSVVGPQNKIFLTDCIMRLAEKDSALRAQPDLHLQIQAIETVAIRLGVLIWILIKIS